MLLALALPFCTHAEAALLRSELRGAETSAPAGLADDASANVREAAADDRLDDDRAAAAEHDEKLEPATPLELQQWIAALGDDGIPRNAVSAIHRLRQEGRGALPALQQALTSRDRQQRQLAAEILRQLAAEPVPALLEASVESLRQDVSAELASTLAMSAATNATRWLTVHAAAAQRALLNGLSSQDPQQRFLSAFLLAQSRHQGDHSPITRELTEHLADNDILGDALMAAHGLWRLGPPALPWLRTFRRWADPQARELIDLIELDLVEHPQDEAALRRRRAMHHVTTVYLDPVVHFDVQRSRVAVW